MSLLLPIASNMAKILNDIDTPHATHYEARMTFQKSRLSMAIPHTPRQNSQRWAGMDSWGPKPIGLT